MSPDRPSFHIIHVCRSYPHHRAGGMENHAQDLIDELVRLGATVHVITTLLPDEPAVRCLETNGEILEIGNTPAGYDLVFYRQLNQAVESVVQRNPVKYIHFQGFGGLFWELSQHWSFGNKPKLSSVHSIHGTLTSETPLFRPIFNSLSICEKLKTLYLFKHRLMFAPFWYLFLKSKPRILVDSEFTEKLLRKIDPDIPVTVLTLGIAEGLTSNKACQNQDNSKQYALYVGRLEKTKNPSFLIDVWKADAAETLPDLVIIGDGAEMDSMVDKVRKLNLSNRIRFTGRISDEERRDLLQKASVFLNPDLGYPAFGLTNAEALCCGVPVITTPNGAHREVIQKGDGILLRCDPERWMSGIEKVLNKDSEEKHRKRLIRARNRFQVSHMGERYFRYLSETQ